MLGILRRENDLPEVNLELLSEASSGANPRSSSCTIYCNISDNQEILKESCGRPDLIAGSYTGRHTA